MSFAEEINLAPAGSVGYCRVKSEEYVSVSVEASLSTGRLGCRQNRCRSTSYGWNHGNTSIYRENKSTVDNETRRQPDRARPC